MKILFTCLVIFSFFASQINAQTDEEPQANWPKEIVAEKYTVNIYQPQNESYSAEKNELVSRAAFSIKVNDIEGLTFGSMWTNASLSVDRESRMMSLASVEVTDVRFPDEVEESKIEMFKSFIEGEIPKWEIEFPQDELIASLEEVENMSFDELATSPPAIVFSNEPAVLLFFDGEIMLNELDKKYDRVVNTAMFLVKEKKSGKYYLSGGDLWYEANDPKGPWEYKKKVSKKLKKLKEEHFTEDDENKEDDLDVPVKDDEEEIIPKIVVATSPTELIFIDGEAKFVPIQNTNLLYVDNTESDLFMNIETQQYYILLSGRWFTSKNTTGPWKYIASDQLPEDFANIPEGSPKDVVLASVAGTDAAQEAIYDAYIPQTAAIDRKTATASVEYDGDPQFEQIEGISLQYAVNTASSVLKSDDVYYLCDNAVWFVADSPIGPWIVADERPEEVDEIPPSYPIYNVKYVYIYETTPSVVYVGYLPGYHGCFVMGPTIVFGTGFWYPGWHGAVFFPRPMTFGFGFHYNPFWGWSVGFSVRFGSPFRWYGYRGFVGPRFFRPPVHFHRPVGGFYGRGARVAHHNRHRYNNNFNRNAYANRRGASQYNRPSTRPSQSGNRPSTRPSQPSNSPSQRPSTNNRTRNNVYSDKQGNVQRRTDNGWQQRNNNSWSQPGQNNRSNQQMNKSYENRQRGAQRSQNYSQQRSRSASPSRSARPSGGSRGGGGRRR